MIQCIDKEAKEHVDEPEKEHAENGAKEGQDMVATGADGKAET